MPVTAESRVVLYRREGPLLDVLNRRVVRLPIVCLLRTRWDRLLDHEPAAAQDSSGDE